MENWYFSAMDMQCASYHSAVQRLPTFNAFLCLYPYRKTKNHISTLTESFRALAIKLWKQVQTIFYCPSSIIYYFIFFQRCWSITSLKITPLLFLSPFLQKKAALPKTKQAKDCVWNMSIWSSFLEWSSIPFFFVVVIWGIYMLSSFYFHVYR